MSSSSVQLTNILDSLPYDILVIDTDFVVQMANRTYLKNNGLEIDQVVGKYCYDLSHKTKGPCSVDVDGCQHHKSLLAGETVSTVVKHDGEDGSERFAALRVSPIRDADGTVNGVVESCLDITDRIKTEEALKATRAHLDQFIDAAPLFVYMKDIGFRYQSINRHGLQVLGRTRDEVIGKTDFDLLPERYGHEIQRHERQAIAQRQKVRVEGVMPRDGRALYYSAEIFPLLRENEVVGVFGLLEDVTDMRASEMKLRRQQAKLTETREYLQGILKNSRDMIFLTDPAGMILSWNKGAESILGVTDEEARGRLVPDFCAEPDAFLDLWEECVSEGHSVGFEIPFRHADGSDVVCSVSLTTILDASDHPIEVVGICRDLTARLRLQKDLIHSDRLAAIGKMAAGVAHEINNPLAVMDQISGLIRETIDDEKEALAPATVDILDKSLTRLSYQIRRCTGITHGLLGFTRKSRSGLSGHDVRQIMEETLNLLAPELADPGIEIRRAYQQDLPEVTTDEMLVQQICVNLIKNAIDAIVEKSRGRGCIEIGIAAVDEGVEIAIQDNGVGIPASALDQIFDLFHTSKPAGKGTGLGLAIVHDLVERLHGHIHVESEQGEWTRFTLTLPFEAAAGDA